MKTQSNNDEVNISRLEAMNLLCTLPTFILQVVSPRNVKFSKFARVPLFIILSLTGAFSAISYSLLKCSTELFKSEGYSCLACLLFVAGLVFGASQICSMNVAIQFY